MVVAGRKVLVNDITAEVNLDVGELFRFAEAIGSLEELCQSLTWLFRVE